MNIKKREVKSCKVGDRFVNRKGLGYTVTKVNGAHDVTVNFEDGHERTGLEAYNVVKSAVRHTGHFVKIGDVFENKLGSSYEVVDLIEQKKALVKFLDSAGYERWSDMKEVRSGAIKNPFFPEVCGVGYIGVGQYECQTVSSDGKKKNKEAYEVWRGVLRRCYDLEHQATKTPSYGGCFVNIIWHNYQNFAHWYYSHQYRQDGWHLDKDVAFKGNREYSPLLCAFVPVIINSAITTSKSRRGEYPVGVYFKKDVGKFRSQLATFGSNQRMLVESSDPMVAFYAYKQAKEVYLKELADLYKDEVDPMIYKGLYNWTVSEDD